MDVVATVESSRARSSAAYYCVGTTKLILMTLATVGIYEYYWLIKNWQAEKEASDDPSIWPIFRGFFGVIFLYSLATRVENHCLEKGNAAGFSPMLLTVVFVGLTLAGRLPEPYFLLALASVGALIPLQNAMARLNDANGDGPGPEARFSVINLVWLAIAGIIWALAILGSLLPAEG